jgi:hypothetical protein
MEKNALFLSLLCLLSIKYSSGQTEIGNNTYELAFAKVFSLDSHHHEIGVKTSDLHIGTHYQAVAKVEVYSPAIEFSPWEFAAPFLFGFSTVKEPPLPNYATDYQNISIGKTHRMTFKCEDNLNEDCINFTTEKYDTNDIQIFKKMLLYVAKKLLLEKDDDDNFRSFKDVILNVDIKLIRENASAGLIKSIRIPGVDEITDLTPFIDIQSINVYPNPSSNGIFTMSFYAHTVIDICYTIKNQNLQTVIDKTLSSLDMGSQTIQLNPDEPLQTGTYYLEATVGTKHETLTLIVD